MIYYAIFSKRGIWIETQNAEKKVNLFYKSTAEKKAKELCKKHKLAYTIKPVELKVIKIK